MARGQVLARVEKSGKFPHLSPNVTDVIPDIPLDRVHFFCDMEQTDPPYRQGLLRW